MPGTDPGNGFQVSLPAFQGPLDLLLQLVERDGLPVTDVSLAEVTDAYLDRIEHMEVAAEEMSHFLVVASRLLLIKSRRLLPRPAPEEADPSAEELAEQLRTYQRYKLAAAALREHEQRMCYPQLVPPAKPNVQARPISLPAAVLERALRRSLRRMEDRLPEGPPIAQIGVRLSDVVARAERLLQLQGSVRLDELSGPARNRLELILAFMAALDLIRRRRAVALQDGLFAPIVLLPVETSDTLA